MYLEYAVETVTVTILKHGGKAEMKIPVIRKTAGRLCCSTSSAAIGVPWVFSLRATGCWEAAIGCPWAAELQRSPCCVHRAPSAFGRRWVTGHQEFCKCFENQVGHGTAEAFHPRRCWCLKLTLVKNDPCSQGCFASQGCYFLKRKGLDESVFMRDCNSDENTFSSIYKALFRVSIWTCTCLLQLKLSIVEIQAFDISDKFSFRQNSDKYCKT